MRKNGATSKSPGERTQALLEALLRTTRREKLCAAVVRVTRAPAPLVEDVFQEACERGWQGKCRGQNMGEVYNWLQLTTVRLVQERLELAHWRREVLVGSLGEGGGDQLASPATEDEVIEREKERELAGLVSAALAELDERHRAVAALHSHGLTGPAIAERLNTSERRVKHLKAETFAGARDALVDAAGGGCEEGERLISRYSFGLASPNGRFAAQLHIASCDQCATLYRRLELAHEKIAALLPIPAVVEADPALLERIALKSADAFVGAKQQASDAVGLAKQHATASYARAAEYSPLAGARPGAAVTAIAGCLALGGGAATYCAENNINPIAGFVDAVQSQPARPKSPPKATQVARQTREPPPLPPVTQEPAPPAPEPPVVEPAPTTAPAPPPPPPPALPPEPTPPGEQFGEPATTATPAAAAASTPAPAPEPQSAGSDLYGP